MEAYISLAQPDPFRLPDRDELAFYQAAQDLCSAHFERQLREIETARSIGERLKDRQIQMAAYSAFGEALRSLSGRMRQRLSHVEGYAQTILDYGRDLPWDEEKRLAGVIVEESQEMREDALLVEDIAEVTCRNTEEPEAVVEFSGVYAESLEFLTRMVPAKEAVSLR